MSRRHGLPLAIAALPPLALALTLLSAAGFGHAAQGQPPQLELERTIALPNVPGRIDHLAVDVSHQRLFVAELGNGSVDAVDLSSGATRRIGGLKEPQGLAYLPDRNELVVTSAGDGTVRFFDASSLKLRRFGFAWRRRRQCAGRSEDRAGRGRLWLGRSGGPGPCPPRGRANRKARGAPRRLPNRRRRPKGVRERSRRAQDRRRRLGLRPRARKLARCPSRELSHGPWPGLRGSSASSTAFPLASWRLTPPPERPRRTCRPVTTPTTSTSTARGGEST